MPSEELLNAFSDHPGLIKWAAIIAFGVYVLRLASQMSETVAGLLGGIGRRWRRAGERTTRSARRREETNAKVLDLENTVKHLAERLDESDKKATEARIREDLKSDYLTYDADWHYRNERHAASHGWAFPEPHHMTFDEYVMQRESGHG